MKNTAVRLLKIKRSLLTAVIVVSYLTVGGSEHSPAITVTMKKPVGSPLLRRPTALLGTGCADYSL